MTHPARRSAAALALALAWLPPLAAGQAPEAEGTPPEAEAAPPEAGPPEAGPPGAAVDLSVGIGAAGLGGSRWKLEQHGRAAEGVTFDHLRLQAPGFTPADRVELSAENVRQDDEAYALTVSRARSYRLRIDYASIPRVWARAAYLHGGVGTDRLRIADAVQAELERNEQTAAERGPAGTDTNTDTTGEDALQQGLVRGLYEAVDRRDVASRRRRYGVELSGAPFGDLGAWVRVHREDRGGTRPIGIGTYERWPAGSGAAHTADRFMVLGAELPAPIDHRTLGVTVGGGLHRREWSAEAEYTFTQFRNMDQALRWDNPFRATDATQVAGGLDRGRFTVGQLVLAPDSRSHELGTTVALPLPLHGRLVVSASAGVVTQDDRFQPYTLNSAITATDLDGNPAGPAPAAALPARDLDGEVLTFAGTLAASAHPGPIALHAKYRVYRYDNRSAEITFPGYAAFGESAWRRERNDVTAELDAPVRNEPFDYWRHDADAGGEVRLGRRAAVSAELFTERWRFTDLRLSGLSEWGARGAVKLTPGRGSSLQLGYRYSDRTASGYERGATAANAEARGQLNYNWADRVRHAVDARARVAAGRGLSLGLLGRFAKEEYGGETRGGEVVDRFRFGRTAARRWLGSLDAELSPAERLSLNAAYSIERRREEVSLAAKDDAVKAADDFGFNDNFAPENYWDSDLEETVHTLDVGASVQVVPERLGLDVGYALSLSGLQVDTRNPNGVSATTLENAVATPWPDVRTRLHSAYADLGWQLSEAVRAGVRYRYERFTLDDFAYDFMAPYVAGRTDENSTRYVFADSVYGDYDAHLAGVYAAGSF